VSSLIRSPTHCTHRIGDTSHQLHTSYRHRTPTAHVTSTPHTNCTCHIDTSHQLHTSYRHRTPTAHITSTPHNNCTRHINTSHQLHTSHRHLTPTVHVASTPQVPASGGFFLAYVLLQMLGRFPMELANPGALAMQTLFLSVEKIDTQRMEIMEPITMDYG
jgi:hypothetical protein